MAQNHRNGTPAYKRIQGAILKRIEAGQLKTGDAVDSERELARIHKVSLMTARHALAALEREAAALGTTPADALAIGDGANDLAMIKAAGLGVAYRAKPIVAAEAFARIEHTSLATALFFQGYRRNEFAA